MKKTDYINKRDSYMAQAQAAIDAGKLEKSEQIMADIKALDAEWETTAKAQANLKALTLDYSGADVPEYARTSDVMGDAVDSDPLDSIEYRKAFARYVGSNGAYPIPAKYRGEDTGPTKTTDIGAVIPTVIVNRIVERLETIGNILPLVTRTAYEPGMSVPVASVKPVASWVAEGNGSDKQKVSLGASIVFAGYKLRCEVTISLEAATRSLDFFETWFVNAVSKAMTKALESAIVSGSGSGCPKGILAETPESGQAVETVTANKLQYKDLVAAESALPAAYEDGAVWVTTKLNFGDVEGMTDNNGQPIARVNYGIDGKTERKILGRPVVIVDALPVGAPWGFIFRPEDYILNTNYAMRVATRENWDNENQETKAVMIADGKAIDINSLVTLTIKAS